MGFFNNQLPTITQPGHLDRRAGLYSRANTPDILGQPIATWTLVETVFAAWQPEGGSEEQTASQLAPLQRGTLRIRYRTDITSDWRVLLGSVNFEIVSPPVEVGRRAFLDLQLRSLNQSVVSP